MSSVISCILLINRNLMLQTVAQADCPHHMLKAIVSGYNTVQLCEPFTNSL